MGSHQAPIVFDNGQEPKTPPPTAPTAPTAPTSRDVRTLDLNKPEPTVLLCPTGPENGNDYTLEVPVWFLVQLPARELALDTAIGEPYLVLLAKLRASMSHRTRVVVICNSLIAVICSPMRTCPYTGIGK